MEAINPVSLQIISAGQTKSLDRNKNRATVRNGSGLPNSRKKTEHGIQRLGSGLVHEYYVLFCLCVAAEEH